MEVILNLFYSFVIAFILIFVSELGDKTQLLALSFSTKLKCKTILLGVALGALFSHGIAIMFGSFLGNINNIAFQYTIKIITYLSFIVFGIFTLLKSNNTLEENRNRDKNNIKSNLGYVLLIAFSIAIGELGDKTFLASIGLGIEYSCYKIFLILGAVTGMVISDLIAIIFGKALLNKISEKAIQNLSGFLFLIFGFLGLLKFLF